MDDRIERCCQLETSQHKGIYDAHSTFVFQLQNDKRRLDQEVEEIRKEMEGHRRENERLKQELNSLRYSTAHTHT